MNAPTLSDLIDTLLAARRAGGFRYDSQERVLRQFTEHSRRDGYPDGSIIQEAVEEFLYGRHLKASTNPPRGDHPSRTGRTRPPVRLASMAAASADTREDPPPAAALRVQRRGDLPPLSRDRHPAAVGDVEQGAGRPGAVPGSLRHRDAPIRSAQSATARRRSGLRHARGARREEPREPPRARHPTPRRLPGELYRGRAPPPRARAPPVPRRRPR